MEWSKRRCHGVRVVTTAGVQSTSPAPILQEFRFLGRLRGPQWQPTSVVCAASTSMIAVLLTIMMSFPPAATMQVAARLRASDSDMNHHGWKLHSVPTQVDRSKAPQHRTTVAASGSLSDNPIGPPASDTVPPTTTITTSSTGSSMTSDRMSPGNRRRGKTFLTGRLSNLIPMTLNGSDSEITVAAPARRHGRSHHTGARNPDKIKLKQCECH